MRRILQVHHHVIDGRAVRRKLEVLERSKGQDGGEERLDVNDAVGLPVTNALSVSDQRVVEAVLLIEIMSRFGLAKVPEHNAGVDLAWERSSKKDVPCVDVSVADHLPARDRLGKLMRHTSVAA